MNASKNKTKQKHTSVYLFFFEMLDLVFFILDVEKVVEGGVDVERRDEAFLGVEAEGGHLGRMLVDEPLREAE